MIQLPEVEIIRRDLDRDIQTKRIKSVEVNSTKTIKRSGTKAKFAAALEGLKVENVTRIGTWIFIAFDNETSLAIHLGSTGLLRRNANKDKVDPNTLVTIGFTQHGQLRLVDSSGEAQMVLVDEETLEERVPELASLGMDPLANPMSWTDFGRRILNQKPTMKLKTLLTDDSVVVGLGECYSDEVLFSAGLRYDRNSDSLNTQELRRFYRGLVETLHDAVKYRGTSLESAPFVDPAGESGSYQDHLQVYGKHGALSPRTRQPLVRSKFAGRWTYYCEQSQV